MREQEHTLSERVQRLENFLQINCGDQQPGCDQRAINEEAYTAQKHESVKKPPRDRTSLEEVLQQLSNLATHGEHIAGKLEDTANRIYGHMPEEATRLAGDAAMPDAMVDQLFIACNRLGNLMSRFDLVETRLSRV